MNVIEFLNTISYHKDKQDYIASETKRINGKHT